MKTKEQNRNRIKRQNVNTNLLMNGFIKRFAFVLPVIIALVTTTNGVYYGFAESEYEGEYAGGYYNEYGEWVDGEPPQEEVTEEATEGTENYTEGESTEEVAEETTEETEETVEGEEEVMEYAGGYYNEYGEWVVVDEGNEYTGEYVDEYSESAALQEEAQWQQEYWPSENTESEAETEEKEQQVLPIVAPDGSIRMPVLSSGAAAVYCRNTGELIFAKNGDKRLSPYSITKLLTCLLAVQKLPLDKKVTVSEAAASQEGSTMNLLPGEEVTVEQLLYGTMILSGNDSAYALAETVSGDVEAFVALMNDTVKNLGCKNTHFVNPNGLIDDTSKQYTTAKDFLEICKMAFSNETLKVIAGANEYNMPATNMQDAYKMEGHNELLMEGKKGYVAGKTGYWEDDKATIAMNYMEGNLDLIVVALAGELDRRGSDCDQLIEYAVAKVEGLKVVDKDQVVASAKVKRGAVTRVEAVTAGESFIYLPKQASKELIQLVAVLDEELTAPVKAGDPVGVYQVFLADEKIDEVPLIAGDSVDEGWFLSYFGISNQTTIIIGLVLLAIIGLIILRALNIARLKKKQKREHEAKVRSMAEEELRQEKEKFESYRGRFYK